MFLHIILCCASCCGTQYCLLLLSQSFGASPASASNFGLLLKQYFRYLACRTWPSYAFLFSCHCPQRFAPVPHGHKFASRLSFCWAYCLRVPVAFKLSLFRLLFVVLPGYGFGCDTCTPSLHCPVTGGCLPVPTSKRGSTTVC